MEGHCQEKLAAADRKAAEIAASAAAAAALAAQLAIDEEAMHIKTVQKLQDEAQAKIQVQNLYLGVMNSWNGNLGT